MEVGQKTLFLETPRLKGPGAVHSSDQMPWVPLTLPARAAEGAGATNRIPLCPTPF